LEWGEWRKGPGHREFAQPKTSQLRRTSALRAATAALLGDGQWQQGAVRRKLSAVWLDIDIKPDHHLTGIVHKRTKVGWVRVNFGVYLLFAVAFWTAQAHAGCPQGQEAFISCQIVGRDTEVFVCFDDQIATYSYGPIGGAAELQLTEPIEGVDFAPWSGSGVSIHESVTFYNGDYAYNVGGGFDRPFSEEDMQHEPRRFGWVEVTESGEHAASLECIPETVSYGFGGGIYDIKVAAGLIWDPYSYTWVSDRIQPRATSSLRENYFDSVIEYCLPATEFSLGACVWALP
jgi:hypothetical protein